MANLYASDSKFDDGDWEHDDSNEADQVGEESGGEVEQVEWHVEQLIAGAHAEQNLEKREIPVFEIIKDYLE